MPDTHDESDALDTKLRAAGERWRSRQAFEQVVVPTESFTTTVPGRSIVATMRGVFEVVTIVGVAFAVLTLGPLGARLGLTGGQGATATAIALPPVDEASTPEPNVVATPGIADSEAVRQSVIAAITSNPSDFGGVYIERDGTLVIQYLQQGAGRASIEAMLVPGVSFRWEEVERSQSDLLRIAHEIRDRNLPGVFAISVDTIHNQVTVSVGAADSMASVAEALSAQYPSGVSVVFSDDVFVIRPGATSPSPSGR